MFAFYLQKNMTTTLFLSRFLVFSLIIYSSMDSKINTILLILIVLAVGSASSDPIQPNYNYDTFAIQFGRDYAGEERLQHQGIFNENFKEFIKRRNDGEDIEINTFMDWNQTQKADFFNYRSQDNLETPPLRAAILGASPSSLDYRALGRVTEVKDQGSCGSCWDFATTAYYESQIAIATNGAKYDLAEQYGLQCETTYSKGCNGGYPKAAITLFLKTGIPLESNYLYKSNLTTQYYNASILCPDTNRIKLNKTMNSLNVYTNVSIQQLQQYLTDYGPLSVAVYAGHNGFYYPGKTGNIVCPSTYSLDHAVLLVGYNSTHWVIKNSWGTYWGDNGFGYILKSGNDCGIRQQVNVAVLSSSSVTPTTKIQLTISLTDSYGDGWNGNVIAIRQDNLYYSFGSNFTSGKTLGPLYISIANNIEAVIQVYTIGLKTQQIGFTVKFPNGTVLFTQNPGTNFSSNKIFKNFCPSTACVISNTVNYYLTMTDSYGDGWNGNVLAFNQGTVIKTFGKEMAGSTMRSYGPIVMTFERYKNVSVTVNTLGQYTEEVGFQLRRVTGELIASRKAGTVFYAGTVLGTFCPDCLNLSPVPQSPQLIEYNNMMANSNERNNYLISTYVLAGVCALTIVALIIVTTLLIKEKAKLRDQVAVVDIGNSEKLDGMTNNTHYNCGGSEKNIKNQDI